MSKVRAPLRTIYNDTEPHGVVDLLESLPIAVETSFFAEGQYVFRTCRQRLPHASGTRKDMGSALIRIDEESDAVIIRSGAQVDRVIRVGTAINFRHQYEHIEPGRSGDIGDLQSPAMVQFSVIPDPHIGFAVGHLTRRRTFITVICRNLFGVRQHVRVDGGFELETTSGIFDRLVHIDCPQIDCDRSVLDAGVW